MPVYRAVKAFDRRNLGLSAEEEPSERVVGHPVSADTA